MEQKYKVIHCNVEQEYENVKHEPIYFFPVGTQYFEFTVYDDNNRYLELPWCIDNFWIETLPLCKDVFACTEDDLNYKIQYCKENNLRISEISTKIMSERKPYLEYVPKNEQRVNFFLLLTENSSDLVTFPVKICNLEEEYVVPKLFDGVYNIASSNGIKYISVYNHPNGKPTIHNPSEFTIDNPLNTTQYSIFKIQLNLYIKNN